MKSGGGAMTETTIEFSRDNLLKFLDYTNEKSLINPGTVGVRKKACGTILGILDDAEASDLSKIDIEDIIRRHRIKSAGKFVPVTLRGYEGHLRGSIKDFLEWANNPSTWRPNRQERKKTEAVAKTLKKSDERTSDNKSGGLKKRQELYSQQPSIHIDFQIHISPEAKPEQIDKIFASMREHLYPNKEND
jgi:hypothetical protein